MLSEGSSVKGSPEDKQPSGPCIKGSAKISWGVTLALYTGTGTGTGNGVYCSHCTETGVTEYFDPPGNPGLGPNFTEKVGPLTQKTSYFLPKY